MPASQFTVYSASDPSGPGLITGQAGTLLTVLDACLVNGYAGKPAAGWDKPFANAAGVGCYRNGHIIPAGLNPASGLGVVINDNGPNVTSTFKEAWITGWEQIATVNAPVGTGYGQFPLPSQLLTTGHTVIRKSTTADTAGRFWQIWADYATCYIFIQTGDAAGTYYGAFFGDCFSLQGTSDKFRFFLYGGYAENNTSTNQNYLDAIGTLAVGANQVAQAMPGLFIARSYGGGGASITAQRTGDYTCLAPASSSQPWNAVMQVPNGPDNSYYLAPCWLWENGILAKRGRLRGMYQGQHVPGTFADGGTFSGGNDYAGKTFMVVKAGVAASYWVMESSATVETN
jgi:hypothetical protein